MKKVRALAFLFFAVFAVSVAVRAYYHPSGGHAQRQSDTIGMSISLASDLKTGGVLSWFDFAAYPKVLQRGLMDGVNASEFPLLNLLSCPFFLIGPHSGTWITSFLLFLFSIFAAFVILPRFFRLWAIDLPPWLCAMIYFAGGSLAEQSHLVMPESFAFNLVLIGTTFILESRTKYTWSGPILCALGIAAKPTVVIVLAVLPLWVLIYRPKRDVIWKLFASGGAALVFPFYWYDVHGPAILHAGTHGPQIFALAKFEPLKRWSEVTLSAVPWLIWRNFNTDHFPFWTGALWIALSLYFREFLFFAAYVVACLFAISLDGTHIWIHPYYFIGCSIFSVLLMGRMMQRLRGQNIRFMAVALIALFWGLGYNTRINVWITARDHNLWRLGEQARVVAGNDLLITDDIYYPDKLLRMGSPGAILGEEAVNACENPRYAHQAISVLVDRALADRPGPCRGKWSSEMLITEPYAEWVLLRRGV